MYVTITHTCGHMHDWPAEKVDMFGRSWFQLSDCQPCLDAAKAAKLAARPTRGWSNAAKRRAHPLGVAVQAGDGHTVYEDTAFGGGRVRVYDAS